MNLNKTFVLGRLTADPQLRATASGQQVASFSIATNRVWNDKSGQKQEATEFHNIVAWGKQAEIISKFSTKGSMLLVEGRLQTRSWDDKEGQRRKTTEIIAERIQLGPRPGGGSPAGSAPQAAQTPQPEGTDAPKQDAVPIIDVDDEIKSEDLPF